MVMCLKGNVFGTWSGGQGADRLVADGAAGGRTAAVPAPPQRVLQPHRREDGLRHVQVLGRDAMLL